MRSWRKGGARVGRRGGTVSDACWPGPERRARGVRARGEEDSPPCAEGGAGGVRGGERAGDGAKVGQTAGCLLPHATAPQGSPPRGYLAGLARPSQTRTPPVRPPPLPAAPSRRPRLPPYPPPRPSTNLIHRACTHCGTPHFAAPPRRPSHRFQAASTARVGGGRRRVAGAAGGSEKRLGGSLRGGMDLSLLLKLAT